MDWMDWRCSRLLYGVEVMSPICEIRYQKGKLRGVRANVQAVTWTGGLSPWNIRADGSLINIVE